MKNIVIIPSGGSGLRTGLDLPKQYYQIFGKEIIAYTIETFQKSQNVDEIIVACKPEYFDLIKSINNKFNFNKVTKVVESGHERQHSVFNALKSINAADDDSIIVHDAARPFIPLSILDAAIDEAKTKNIVLATRVKDTIYNCSKADYEKREDFFLIQTPQIIKYNILMKCMVEAQVHNFTATDESSLLKKYNYNFSFFEGHPINFKVTTFEDIELMKLLLK